MSSNTPTNNLNPTNTLSGPSHHIAHNLSTHSLFFSSASPLGSSTSSRSHFLNREHHALSSIAATLTSQVHSLDHPNESSSGQSIRRQLLPTFPTLKDVIMTVQTAAIKDWIPHPLSPEEFRQYNRESDQRLASIRLMEAERRTTAPGTNKRLDQLLLLSRIDYRVRYCRTFRINDLPTEIITNIFRYVAWSPPGPTAGTLWRLWLTWTCKHWRTIALADSTLWCAIWFRDPPSFERSLAWFDRAGTSPLDIRINDEPSLKFDAESMGALLDRLFTKVSTIRMLIVIVDDWDPALVVLDKFRSAGKTEVPLTIERFELHRTGTPYLQLGDGYQPSSLREPMALFGGVEAPRLNYFSVNGVHVDWKQSVLSNLTTIDMRRIPIERSPGSMEFRSLLRSSPALRKLCLDGAGPQWHPEDARDLQPVELLELRVFVLADFSVHYALYVLSHINAPRVRDLTLMNLIGEDYTSLFATMTSQFPEVRLLTMYSVETPRAVLSSRTLVKWLASMPSLTYLRMANIKKTLLQAFLYDPETFQHVAQQSTSQKKFLAPRLSILDVQNIDPEIIADWGMSRNNIGAPLSKIYVSRDMANKISRAQYQKLAEVAKLVILERGSKTDEEDDLLN